MYQNWYKKSGKKRDPIVIGDDQEFEWVNIRDIDGSYSVVNVILAGSSYNFYLWSNKTIKTAKKLYEKNNFKKSLNMLKKYSFDVKVRE